MVDLRQVPKRHLTIEDLLNKYGTRLGLHKAYIQERMSVQEARLFEEVALNEQLLDVAVHLHLSENWRTPE